MPESMIENKMLSTAAGDPLADLKLDDMSIPTALRASVERYRLNMGAMIAALRGAALGEAQIEAGVSALAASYRAELVSAMAMLREISLRDTGVSLQ